ncbi:MAG TPA: multiheme c-type cytochrome, partial [Kofleriaceae bacterium]|nr:multiheme c-type cytochrome [Kofleriaceae bacterium]
RHLLPFVALLALAGCRDRPRAHPQPAVFRPPPPPVAVEASLPRAPGAMAPSLIAIGDLPAGAHERPDGNLLADIDTCETCHPDATKQWRSSLHSFASFGNPIYRTNVELARDLLGNEASQHCGGCHDAPLEIDGAMKQAIAADDLRAHTGVSCRVCHGARAATDDGNASLVLAAAPLYSPNVDDPASVERHRQEVRVTNLGNDLCLSCHRGFLSPDLGLPVHIQGIDEPTAWESSAYTGNGAGRVDKVEPKGCIDCHMPEVAVGPDEYGGGDDRKLRGHFFPGGHTWMAAMRKDPEQLARLRQMLVGAASIDIAGAIVPAGAGANGPVTLGGQWQLPADGAPVVPGKRLSFDVVIRNLLVGHRFPGGVNDMQDTWVEVEVVDARGRRIASSGLAHEHDAHDQEAHVLRSYPVGDDGAPLEEHQLPLFRAIAANHTIAARDAQAIRYTFDVPDPVAQPLAVHARLRHRSRNLIEQAVVCTAGRSKAGAAFLKQAKEIRDMTIDPCAAQPITEIASTTVWMGDRADAVAARARHGTPPRAAWERDYEHGMGLLGVITERLDEPKQVLEHALSLLPEDPASARPRAMVLVQLAAVAGRQGRTADALALAEQARALLPTPSPAVIDAVEADALARVFRWADAAPHARAVTERAPGNTAAWVMLARVLGSLHDDAGELAAARQGLTLAPRDGDLLRSQATAIAALLPDSPLAASALAAYDRFRAPDGTAQLRIDCANASARCARERELGHVHVMVQSRPVAPATRRSR